MLYVTLETMEDVETTILAEKSTILDGRRRRENVELKPPQPPSWGWGSGWGLSSAINWVIFGSRPIPKHVSEPPNID